MQHNLAPRPVDPQEPYVAGDHLIKAGGPMTAAEQNLPGLEDALDSGCLNSRCQPVRHAYSTASRTISGL